MPKNESVLSLLQIPSVLTVELENQLATLKSKITLLEAQLESEREKTRNLAEERDEAVQSLANVLNELESLKSENKALKMEIASLKKQLQENLKGSQAQKTGTAKERIKERVEAERRKEGKRNRGDGGANQSFIQVSHSKSDLTVGR
jgi:chromosome segregation ATPase